MSENRMEYQFKSQRVRHIDRIVALLKRGPLDTKQLSVRLGIGVQVIQGTIRVHRELFVNLGDSKESKNCCIWGLKEE